MWAFTEGNALAVLTAVGILERIIYISLCTNFLYHSIHLSFIMFWLKHDALYNNLFPYPCPYNYRSYITFVLDIVLILSHFGNFECLFEL